MSLTLPHGGILKPRILQIGVDDEKKRCDSLPQVRMSSKESSDLVMLATGAFSPLEGFMVREDYLGVVQRMQCADGTVWPIPVTLAVDKEKGDSIPEGQEVALVDEENGECMGLLEVQEKYTYDRKKEAREVFKTEEEAHPGVMRIYKQGEVYLGGPVKALSEGRYPKEFPEFARPEQTRKIFSERGWSTVAAFQTRNPLPEATSTW